MGSVPVAPKAPPFGATAPDVRASRGHFGLVQAPYALRGSGATVAVDGRRAYDRGVTPVRRALLASVALAACAFSSPAAAQTSPATLPSQCYDQEVAPVSVILACADGGIIAEELVWSGWGAERAHATGTASINTCDPDCATGGREEHSIELIADRLLDCPYGEPQYTRVTYRLPASPFPSESRTVPFPCPKRPHADPRIKRMRMRLTGHNPGTNYFVRVHVRLRVCAVRGRSEVVVNETLRIGRDTFAEHTRTIRFRHRSSCQWHRFRWRLRDEFFGVGTYKVAATVWDRDFQFSKTLSRKSFNPD